ncbi:2-succinyl-5-enolpyruvyl-6-hydroxy-3-cyclohexene-1-carboxylic-acid synthase [Coraliomargarita sinensis]|uniref:2-succinyl-5-enolpyruvyl-6-hydroxy-3-cyclohexene-1-carboxylate synthase n=1 Tax=Coraliomargarita sinensis TaxID=2174842 RepID=A0A317ZFA3_9BACT|nr:2-succinyl-5-enolpyruvyl-6-hydroxy-3-cyclohexene-1-carboxylic-acid synthase [Coraliomargarita sinensis]PXA04254.1 2-succinyl-5-enolpyruvyl-6-hydroxy-3-cyclohexene-1-carboxylic-acid synthase [Coraliomargarita sinensis]
MKQSSAEVFDDLSRSNVNSAWGALSMEVLARLGVQTVLTSPGSRSTPLTVAAVRNPKLEALTILDERSAGFFALGLAKRTHRPVALVCTSGSALANYMPAVVEASMSGTPLLLLTADRPPELQDCHSGQTIDQLKFYGDYVRRFHQLALPETELFGYLRQTLVHAVAQSLQPVPGPVHLNFSFRDPLAPDAGAKPVCSGGDLEAAATLITRPTEAVAASQGFDTVAVERLMSHSKGIIVVGTENPPCGDDVFADAVVMLSHKLGWPVLADVLNPLRNHAGENEALVSSYDALLRDTSTAQALEPTAILQIGNLPTSKVLRQWLGDLDASSFLLTRLSDNTDPLHRVATPLYGDAHALAEFLPHQKAESAWIEQWQSVESKTHKRLDEALDAMDELFEGKVAWLLSQYAPIDASVFLANSMSVRYGEYFWRPGNRAISIYCNRGANGIDGTLSTAMGVAHRGKPTILLTGDLAFLHDSNGLLAKKEMQGSLTVLLINNSGSGIFEYLPVSDQKEVFESHFATPQAVDVEQLCAAHSISYRQIESWDQFKAELSLSPESGVRLLELRTDRKADVAKLRGILG